VDGARLSGEPERDRADARARELLWGGAEGADVVDDEDSAKVAARRILEDSANRTEDPATTDPTDGGVIRRTSDEVSEL
jgi:hypothetical protein